MYCFRIRDTYNMSKNELDLFARFKSGEVKKNIYVYEALYVINIKQLIR